MTKLVKGRVVVVDDEPMVRDLLKELLKDLGYEVAAQANNGQVAFDKVKEHKPEIVCLDISMPEINGLDALASIKTFNSDIIVIMVTAISGSSEVQQAIRTGADGYILKPFTGMQVHEAIQKARKRRQASSLN
ncbi:Response regulator receiver domain-containing protein [Marinospirillum celere]|uniref:Response regulator receiver domain-containing protein n=1 Tax=Marinospirillum celere TaxID=1122252 RepID=A0A1I1ETB0_9GAMM|nr:response regulator [Marinospirillum celere]SFB89896.1 Response regulator receiver domain-containing protein [Marinospirillum celere]